MQNPLSTEALVTWLKKQPPRGKYDFQRRDACLLAQYFDAAGFSDVLVSYGTWSQGQPWLWEHVANGGKPGVLSSYHTYGDALKRAEALLAKPKRTTKKRVAA